MTDTTTRAQIRVGVNGSYHVSGGIPLVRIKKDGTVLEEIATDGEYSLCRCGGSSTKPFCSDAHVDIGFDGTESAPTDTYADRAKPLGGEILDDRSICAHAGFCADRVTNVWKAAKALDGDAELKQIVYAMIARCPSGALSAPGADEGLPVRIAIEENGPIHVTGGIRIERSDGAAFETRQRVLLCRCGQSKNKPLCDGSHAETGFRG
jgi:CDGSH-type Zn-finger protein